MAVGVGGGDDDSEDDIQRTEHPTTATEAPNGGTTGMHIDDEDFDPYVAPRRVVSCDVSVM